MGKKNFKKREKLNLEDKKKDKRKVSTIKANTEKTDSPPIDKLLDKADQLIDEFNYELAQKFCQKALETDPDNVRALETSASLLLELGQIDSAKQCLGRAVEVCPESGFSKYMTLGQLMDGATAVQCYQKGIELMIKEKEAKEAEEVAAACSDHGTVSDRDISSAYCAVAEIYLTDCCFDESAEDLCKEFVEKAVSSDPLNAEAWQLQASFLLSKDKKEEAKESIKKSVSLWLPKLQAQDTGEVSEEEFDPVEPCQVPYPIRIQCGKILIECEEYEEAITVLETLLDEDEDVPDVWYLLGWANYLQGGDYYSNARHYLQKAEEVFKKVKYEDMELLGHVHELIKELGPEPQEENGDGMSTLEQDIVSSGEEEMDQ